MIFQWKLAYRLGLFSDFDEEIKKRKRDLGDLKTSDSGKSIFPKSLLPGGKGGNNKSLLVKSLGIAGLVVILYLIFGYNQPSYIEIKEVKESGEKLQIVDSGNSTYDFSKFAEKRAWSASSHRVSGGSSGDQYDIVLSTDKNRKISFRVDRSILEGGWSYKTSNGCTFSKKLKCDDKQATCTCKDSAGSCCCSGDKNCQCASNCKNSSCCACCIFMQWVDYAILNVENPNKVTPSTVFFSLLPSIVYVGLFAFLARAAAKGQGMGGLYGQGGLFRSGQSLSKTHKSNVTFNDVAGIKEEKEELEEIVKYLKDPSKYSKYGARPPKGIMLYGPPGVGKTLLAKAVSGEASVPFIEVSGSSFDDMFVGSGAKRVRDLFAKARKLAPCIVFIDEIDAVAGKRGNKSVMGGGGVADQTINQLLSEMDGFNTTTGIIIIAATNKLDSIDEAILRPGRFDRHIEITLPDIKERLAILKTHARNKNISSSVSLPDVARKTPEFSGAQLENVLNEACLLAIRKDKKFVDMEDINEAIDRTIAGIAKRSRKILEEERKQVAYHEAGHAIAGLYSKGGEVVEKTTIIPRGKTGGFMMSTPKVQESFIKRKDDLLDSVLVTLAGRAAEELFFGKQKISTGAANDLFKVTNLVRSMITKLGMSDDLGLTQYEPSEGIVNPYRSQYSETYSQRIDDEMNKIIQAQYEKAKEIIISNKEEFLLIVECLLLIETIDRDQIEYIHKYKALPAEALEMKKSLAKNGQEIDINVQL